MGQRTEILDLGRLMLGSGEGRQLLLEVPVAGFDFGGQRYGVRDGFVDARLDVDHTTTGYSLRVRFEAALEGPCMRCLDPAEQAVAVDLREVDQPGGGEELSSPYVDGRGPRRGGLGPRRPGARPSRRRSCAREDCLGLCTICGENLNTAGPGHAHESEPDPRWAALRELKLD